MNPTTPKNFLLRDLIFLSLFLSLLFGLFLGARPLMVPDEGRYAEIPREMVASGDYLTPHLNHIKYFEKPALFYWMEAASIRLFGVQEWALRGVVALVALVGCLMVYIAGLRLYDRRTGILSCLVLATCMLYFSMARFIITDMPLTVWMTMSLLLFMLGTQVPTVRKRYYFWGMYVTAALAVMTKGLVGAVLPGMIIFVWLCLTREWKQLKTYCLPTGILLFLLIAAPWHILVQLKNPEFLHFYFIEQHFLRYLTDYAGRQQAIWFFPVVTFGGFFPWICFVLAFLYTTLSQKINIIKIPRTQTTTFFIVWAVVLFIFFSLSKSQLLSYALPIMPPLAVLTARYFSLHWEDKTDRVIRIGFSLVAVLGVLLSISGVFAIYSAHISSPALLYIATGVLFAGVCCSYLLYRYRSIQAGVITLMLTAGIVFILGDVSYPKVDTRSVKPLVVLLKQQVKPGMQVFSYQEYYQDVPPYLGRPIRVAGYKGELEFGMRHQDTSEWMLDEETFWRRWSNQPGLFMLIEKDKYTAIKDHVQFLYVVGETPKTMLIKNFP